MNTETCRWCGKTIWRSPGDDLHVSTFQGAYLNKVSQAWRELLLACRTDPPYRWHEPVPLSLDEMVAHLRVIKADLR